MKFGRLRHRVVIEAYQEVQDSVGQPIKSWNLYAHRWASIEPLGGTPIFRADELFEPGTARFLMRYVPGLVETMRITHRDDIFDIVNIIDVDMKREQHVIIGLRGLTDG